MYIHMPLDYAVIVIHCVQIGTYMYSCMFKKDVKQNQPGYKKCEVNQKHHYKLLHAAKNFDIK